VSASALSPTPAAPSDIPHTAVLRSGAVERAHAGSIAVLDHLQLLDEVTRAAQLNRGRPPARNCRGVIIDEIPATVVLDIPMEQGCPLNNPDRVRRALTSIGARAAKVANGADATCLPATLRRCTAWRRDPSS
jgi:hypothetical protein